MPAVVIGVTNIDVITVLRVAVNAVTSAALAGVT
jgi:hypothetical protein